MRLTKPCLAAALVLAACAPTPWPYADLPRLDVRTAFGVKNLCGLGVSPAIALGRPPASAASYTIRMTDIGVLIHTPWQETVKAEGATVPEGAAATYPGPCPGEFQTSTYRIEVLALDAVGRPVAYGRQELTSRSLDRLVRNVRSGDAERRPGAEPEPADPFLQPASRPYTY